MKQKTIQILDNVIECMVLALPFVVCFILPFGIRWTSGIVGVCLAIVLLLFVLKNSSLSNSLFKIELSTILIALFIAWSFISFFWSIYIDVSLVSLISLVSCGILFVVVVKDFSNIDKIKRLLLSICLSGLLISLLIVSNKIFNIKSLNSLSFRLVNSNFLCSYLGLLLPVCLSLIVISKLKVRLVSIVSFLFIFYTVLMTRDRGGWLQIFVGLVAFIIFLSLNGMIRKKSLFASIFILSIWLIGIFGARDVIAKFIPKTPNIASEATVSQRISVWNSTISLIKEHPIRGTGLGTFQIAYPQKRNKDIHNLVEYAHNSYLQLIQELGLVGFLLFVLLAYFSLKNAVKLIKSSQDYKMKYLYIGIVSACIGLFFEELYGFNLYMPVVSLTFFTFLAALSNKDHVVDIRDVKYLKSVYFLFCLLLFILGGILFYFSWNLSCSVYYNNKAKSAVKNNDMDSAIDLYNKSIAYEPADSYLYRDLSRVYYSQAKYWLLDKSQKQEKINMAKTLLKKSLLLNRFWPDFYIELADIHMFSKEDNIAKTYIDNAISIDKNNGFFYDILGFYYYKNDDKVLAKKSFLRALDIDSHDALAKYYLNNFLQ